MARRTAAPRFDIAVLRKIGFDLWDPIGCPVPKDEYDTYLLKAAGDLWNGQPVQVVIDYLVEVETEWMGLQLVEGVVDRAARVAAAIDSYVRDLRGRSS